MGLSSLGRSEAHVMASLDSVLDLLHALSGRPSPAMWNPGPVGLDEGRDRLKHNTLELLGPKAPGRWVRIMVTMPGDAALQPELVRDLLKAGMNCLRINCAHDTLTHWRRMTRYLAGARHETGAPCQVLFDLAGPKLRTGPLSPGPTVIKLRPTRDELGRTTSPARVWLTPAEHPTPSPDADAPVLPLPRAWLDLTHVGDVVRFEDARGASRKLTIASAHGHSRWAECLRTAYVTSGTRLTLKISRQDERHTLKAGKVGPLPPREQSIVLAPGDILVLTRDPVPGRPARLDRSGRVKRAAHISCTAPEVFGQVRTGEQVWLDDGKIGGLVESASRQRLVLRIVHARPKGEKLRADKGINFPDSRLRLPPLSATDRSNLRAVARHADLIGYSFVQRVSDIETLQKELSVLGASGLGIVLKIETRQAFEHLPELLLTAMRSPRVGVMIARGDLAVECGYERMAEIQEEILWLCEAAHVPVIWATQVLENLSKSGAPTRAEVTDAAMSVRAECVMLNKGPEIVAAVRVLDNILRRMQAHQNKKQSMLRSLSVARNFLPRAGRRGRALTTGHRGGAPPTRWLKAGPRRSTISKFARADPG